MAACQIVRGLVLPLLLLALLLTYQATAKRVKRQRLKDGDRAACACYPGGYVVDVAERACSKHGETDLFELCSADELAAAQHESEEPPPTLSPPPSSPSSQETAADRKRQSAILSPRERAEMVADHIVTIENSEQLTALIESYTIVLLAVGTASEKVPCKPCGVLTPNLKLAAAHFNATWGQDSYASHGSAVFAATSSDSIVGAALAVYPGFTTLPTLFLYTDGGGPRVEVAKIHQIAASSGKPHKREAVTTASKLPAPHQRLDKLHRKVIWNEAGLSGYVLDELSLAESRKMVAMAATIDGSDGDPEKLVIPIHSYSDLETLQGSHSLVMVKAVKTGCKHCEHLAPHFDAAAAACTAAAAAREAGQGGKIAFAVAKDNVAINLFNVKSYPTMLLFLGKGDGRPVLTLTRADPLLEWKGTILASFLEEQLARVMAGIDVQAPKNINTAELAQQARQGSVHSSGDESDAHGCCDRGAAETGIRVTLPADLAMEDDADSDANGDEDEEEEEPGISSDKNDL